MERDDYERIVRTHMDTIYRIAVSYTKTPSDADDIVQQTFVKLLTKRISFTDAEHESGGLSGCILTAWKQSRRLRGMRKVTDPE